MVADSRSRQTLSPTVVEADENWLRLQNNYAHPFRSMSTVSQLSIGTSGGGDGAGSHPGTVEEYKCTVAFQT